MAIADLDEYKAALLQQREIVAITGLTQAATQGRLHDGWRYIAPTGLLVTTAAAPTSATTGALGQLNPAGGSQLSIVGVRMNSQFAGSFIVCDRLSHQGGLVANVSTTQTTNLPTAALTRYTGGDGVMLGITIQTAIGSTATTISAEYTNQAGTGSKNTPLVQIGGTGFNGLGRFILLPLESGDTGVRSVESVTLTASTGTAGSLGVVLFKPLYAICVSDASAVPSAAGFITGNTCGGVAKVEDDACLFVAQIVAGNNAAASGAILLEEN
jgi:hypothetical protein